MYGGTLGPGWLYLLLLHRLDSFSRAGQSVPISFSSLEVVAAVYVFLLLVSVGSIADISTHKTCDCVFKGVPPFLSLIFRARWCSVSTFASCISLYLYLTCILSMQIVCYKRFHTWDLSLLNLLAVVNLGPPVLAR